MTDPGPATGSPRPTRFSAIWGTVVSKADGLRHAGWGVVDQGLSSVTNFGVGLVAARTSTPEEFGAFSVAFATYLIGIGVIRAMISDVYSVQFAAGAEGESQGKRSYPFASGAWGAALGVSLVGMVACGVAVLLTSGPLRQALIIVGLGLPVLVLQDVARYICFARRDAFGAALFDLSWVIGFAAAVAVMALVEGELPGATLTLVAWVIGAACGCLMAAWRFRVIPHPMAGMAFVRRDWRRSARYGLDWVALGGSLQLGYYVLGATAGLAVVGNLRAGMLLLGPLNIIVVGAVMVAVPELVRHRSRTGSSLMRPALLLSGAVEVITIAWFVMVAVLPPDVLTKVLGDAAVGARSLLLPLFIMTSATTMAQGPLLALRATGDTRAGTRATAPVAPLYLLGGTIGAALLGGASGAALGWAVAAGASGLLAVWQLRSVAPHTPLDRLVIDPLDVVPPLVVADGDSPDP